MLLSIEGISICWTKNFSCCKSTNASSCLVHSKIYQFIFGWTIFKVDTSKFYSFLVVFNTFSPTYAYVFFRVCRHHSTKSAKWGHLIPFAPLSASGRQLSPLPPPGFAAYDNYSHSLRRPHPGFYPGTFWGGTSPQTSQLPPKNFWPALIS